MSKNKKIALVIASKLFRDEEYFIPRQHFEALAFDVVVASSSLNPCRGMLQGIVKADVLVDSLHKNTLDALVFVGGSGAVEYWDHTFLHQLIQQMHLEQKCIAAICIAPVILAHSGILYQRKATVYPSEIVHIVQYGAIYVPRDIVTDHHIITANGPEAASSFAQAISKFLIA